jgi:hypothetical protein
MADDFRIRNARFAKPHSCKVGDSVLLSTKNINLSLPCKKLSPAFVGPFSIRALLGTNTVQLNYSRRFQLLSPTFNLVYLRPYRLRTPDIGPPPKSLSVKPIEVEVDGSSWYQVEDILDHRDRAGPLCECLVRWKDFDASHDSWVQRKFLTPLAFQDDRYSVLKASNNVPSSATTSPITAASKMSDVASNAPTAGVAVAPISTSSSGWVIRRPNHYKDTRR